MTRATLCDCGWYKTDSPSDIVRNIHDGFVGLRGKKGVWHLNEAIFLAKECVERGEIRGLEDLAERHGMSQDVRDLAENLDELLRYRNEYDRLWSIAHAGKGLDSVCDDPALLKMAIGISEKVRFRRVA